MGRGRDLFFVQVLSFQVLKLMSLENPTLNKIILQNYVCKGCPIIVSRSAYKIIYLHRVSHNHSSVKMVSTVS